MSNILQMNHALLGQGEPSLERPISQACTYNQFINPIYTTWCQQIGEAPRLHRKQWEFCYILQALSTHGMLCDGLRGLGYGVGNEPLAAAMAARGCDLVVTDCAYEQAKTAGWVNTSQHAGTAVNDRGLCDPKFFRERVRFRVVDMNAIPYDLAGFDFTWSACALEHLGSIANGSRFIKESLRPLASGGIAVHTTELNCYSNDETVDNDGTVLFRRRDIEQIALELLAEGHKIELTFDLGGTPFDNFIDMPPYRSDPHLKLQLGRFATTSYGLIIRKA